MKAGQIKVGGFYVNEEKGLGREVWGEKGGNVHWRGYNVRSGKPLGGLTCSKDHLARWADRGATPEEVSRLNRVAAHAEEAALALDMVELVVRGAPDDLLIAELRGRGYDVTGKTKSPGPGH